MNKTSINKADYSQSSIERISSVQIKPIQINQSSAIFNINPQGILDKDSSIVLPLITDLFTKGGATIFPAGFLPVNIGIWSVLKSATLKSLDSGVVIAQNNDCANWCNIHNNFQSSEWRDRVLKCRWGVKEVYEPSDIGVMITHDEATANPPAGINLKGVQYATELIGENKGENLIGAWSLSTNRHYRVMNNSSNTGQFYIRLNELFPKMFNVVLPTNHIKGMLQLILNFNNVEDRLCRINEVVENNLDISARIDEDNVVLLADFIHKKDDSDIQAQINSPNGMVFSYGDLMWNKFFHNGGSANTINNQTHNLGLSGQYVRQLYMLYNSTDSEEQTHNPNPYGDIGGVACPLKGPNQQNPLKLTYDAVCPSNVKNGFKFQININQRNLYPERLENKGEYMNELTNAYGARLNKPFDSYCADSSSVQELDKAFPNASDGRDVIGNPLPNKGMLPVSGLLNGWWVGNLYNTNFIVGVDLQKKVLDNMGGLSRVNMPQSGTLIGNTPIMLHTETQTTLGDNNLNLNVCACVERTIMIRNGIVSVVD